MNGTENKSNTEASLKYILKIQRIIIIFSILYNNNNFYLMNKLKLKCVLVI